MRSGTLILLAVVAVLVIGVFLLIRQSRRLRSSASVRREESGPLPGGGSDHC